MTSNLMPIRMAKYRALLPERFLTVEAEDAYHAQNLAAVLIARGIKPQDVAVQEAQPGDLFWDEESAA